MNFREWFGKGGKGFLACVGVCAWALIWASCTPTTPPPDAAMDSGDVCVNACTALQRLGCPEGKTVDGGQSCVDTCHHTQTTAVYNLNWACFASQTSVSGIRSCGSVSCPGVN
jgi:hypothetical protein